MSVFKPTKLGHALPLITVILLIVAAVLLGVQEAVQLVDVADAPPFWHGVVIFLKSTFSGGLVALGLIWLRNIFGFLKVKSRAQVAGVVEEYNIQKFYETFAYYTGSIAIVFNAAPNPEIRVIGTVTVFFIDLLGSVFASIFPKKK